jgi:hypothetical protein
LMKMMWLTPCRRVLRYCPQSFSKARLDKVGRRKVARERPKTPCGSSIRRTA